MIPSLTLPPIYDRLIVPAGVDPVSAAVGAVENDEDGALFVWCDRADALRCAVLLWPEEPLASAQRVLHLGAVALGDALGALLPPIVAVQFRWPDRLQVNGAFAGGVRLAVPRGCKSREVPDWLVLEAMVRISGWETTAEPGENLAVTTVAEESGADMDSAELAEGFARHFLSWTNRWRENGFEPVSLAWWARADGRGETVDWRMPRFHVAGEALGLDEQGGLRLKHEGVTGTLPLAPAVTQPTWEW